MRFRWGFQSKSAKKLLPGCSNTSSLRACPSRNKPIIRRYCKRTTSVQLKINVRISQVSLHTYCLSIQDAFVVNCFHLQITQNLTQSRTVLIFKAFGIDLLLYLSRLLKLTILKTSRPASSNECRASCLDRQAHASFSARFPLVNTNVNKQTIQQM